MLEVPEETIPSPQQPTPPTSVPASPASNDSMFTEDDFPPLPSHDASSIQIVQQPAPQAPLHPMVTRAKDGIRKPNPKYVLVSVKSLYHEPKSVDAALKDLG